MESPKVVVVEIKNWERVERERRWPQDEKEKQEGEKGEMKLCSY